MRNDSHRSHQKLSTRKKTILQMVLAAYLLVAIGLFSWMPLFLFQHGDTHRVTVQNSGHMVSWTMHHLGETPHDADLRAAPVAIKATAIHDPVFDTVDHKADHVLATPSDDFVKHMLKIVVQAETLTIFSGLLLLWAFFALLKFFVPRDTGRVPIFNFPIRNSISILTRTVVLRH
ncbi:MAG TPA: hypothetical protein VIH30_03760 [Aquirhabdus sp.]